MRALCQLPPGNGGGQRAIDDTSLKASIDAGMKTGMNDMRKITVQVPETLLVKAQAFTGEGVTETVREGLKKLAATQAQQELRNLRGTFKFTVGLNELREDRTFPKSRK
jgi:hypothetical protein